MINQLQGDKMKLIKYLLSLLGNNKGFATLNLHTYNSGAGEFDDAIPEFWNVRLYDDGIRKAFWGSKFEGKEGSSEPIITKDDFIKGPGDVIHFQVLSNLISSGVTGESTLAGNEDKLSMSQFDLTVDWIRNAVAFTENLERRVNFSIMQVARQRLSNWIARFIDEGMFTQLITTDSPDEVYAGDAASEAALGANDIFGTEEIDRIKLALQRKGAIPISVKMDNGEELDTYGIVISEIDEYWLKGDSVWQQAQRDSGIRGDKNRIFTGALGIYNGCILYVHRSVKSALEVQGSPLRPECRLSTTIGSSGETTITVGTNTKADYTKFFPSTGTLRIDSEEITYSAKSVTTFTINARAQNATSAAIHTAGALMTLRNVSTQIGFGAEIAVRGWGMKPTPITQLHDYGFENGIGVKAIFGQIAVKDTSGNEKNYLLMKSYASNPGTI